MIRSVVTISLITSIFFFQLGIPRAALVPLLVCMYFIFTDGHIERGNKERQFSRYHILFGLWCIIALGLTLLLHTLGVSMLTILLIILGFHVLIIWLTLIGGYRDEFTMFHIGYYFTALIIAWYVPMQFGLDAGIIARLLFPIITFLLYAGGSFFINPFISIPRNWHYRTGIFFIISFLSSTILFFFSSPLIGWACGLVFYTMIVRFLSYQYKSHIHHEKDKRVYAEDILEGKKVIQPKDSWQNQMQETIYNAMRNMPGQWRGFLIGAGGILLLGVFITAFSTTNTLVPFLTFLILGFTVFLYYDGLKQWERMLYPVMPFYAIIGATLQAIFVWTIWKYIGFDAIVSCVFLTMGRNILNHGVSVFLGGQAQFRASKKKYPLLYGYVGSNVILAILVCIFLPQVFNNATLTTSITLLYLGIVGVMVYFFFRSLTPMQNNTMRKTREMHEMHEMRETNENTMEQ